LAGQVLAGNVPPEGNDPEIDSWVELIRQAPEPKLRRLMERAPASSTPHATCDEFFRALAADFALAPVKVRALREYVDELKERLDAPREDNEVVYWAVASTEPAGKPLSACHLVPVKLGLTCPGDLVGEPPNRVSGMKFAKILRYATQAKYQGGYLTYADLSYLLGIHTEAISRLAKANSKLVVPLRGQECDIGRGITHKKKIVELYLQLYTESEIVARTGHSYESIEAYIKEFAAVLVMSEKGMSPTLIRRVLGKSLKLVKAYLDLVREYSTPEHAFRLAHMRQLFLAHQGERQKRGPVL